MNGTRSPKGGLVLHHGLFVIDADLRSVLPPQGEGLIAGLVDELLTTISMERLGPLEIFPATDMRAPGYSFIQPITTSHICGHYFGKPGKHPHFHFDIYSCKKFSWRKVIPVLDRHLSLGEWSANCITRKIGAKRECRSIRGVGREIAEERRVWRNV